jgi:hypothetical protein
MHFIKNFVKKFQQSSRDLAITFKLLNWHGGFHENIIEDRLNVDLEVFSEEV